MLRRCARYSLLLVLVLVWPLSALADQQLDSSREQLAEIEQRLERTLADLASKKKIESDVLGDLEAVDRKLRRLRKKVSSERQKLAMTREALAAGEKELKRRKQAVSTLEGEVRQRLVALYKSEETGVLKTLFSASSLDQMLEDYDFLGRMVEHDRQLLRDFRQRVVERAQAVEQLESAKQKQQAVTESLKRKEESLQRTARLKKRYLGAVRKDRRLLDKTAADLRARAERLTGLVKELEAGAGGDADAVSLFALQKGLLPWPVSGNVKSGFGKQRHPELGTLLENHGIEIAVKPATAVRAVWEGRVAFAKRFKGYGNLLIIDHDGDYYTLYAQVRELQKKTDDRVKKGDLIAYSGYDDADHLYFEIRKGRTPIDPLQWIEKR